MPETDIGEEAAMIKRKTNFSLAGSFLFCSISIALCLFFPSCSPGPSVPHEAIRLEEISRPVEIIKDRWGISHIYAQNQKDLFFAQGFNVARDRLFQLEIWRRQASGTLSEILGSKALQKDIGSRLLRARVDLEEELGHYHPQGIEIITSFVRGINACIDLATEKPDLLPLEFKLLGIQPQHWTPEIVVSRHNGLFRNAGMEISIARAVWILGEKKVRSLLDLEPGNPELEIKPGIDPSLLSGKILDLYFSSRSPVRFGPEDIVDQNLRAPQSPLAPAFPQTFPFELNSPSNPGSNNWVVRGGLTSSEYPFMANDPHRSLQVPSLRYWVHLNAPGWNVIGGGEPALPGVSIGHNDQGAWGLTIFATDQEDLYVYETNPDQPNRYRYKGSWEEMKIFRETIPVKGEEPVAVDLKYTRHGPVLYEDKVNNKAYALRAAWLEAGSAPYLASLRMDQSRNWEEFREACRFSNTPSENMVWADRENNIGWQAVGIAPIRKNWSGLLPVPGDGRFEWEGFLPGGDLPHTLNPHENFFATANQYNVPDGYPYPLGFMWSEPFRFERIEEVLRAGGPFSREDMAKLQQDTLSVPARALVPYLQRLHSSDEMTEKAIQSLLSWDYQLDEDSVEAAIFAAWIRRLRTNLRDVILPESERSLLPRPPLKILMDVLARPDEKFGGDPLFGRDELLLRSLEQGIEDLEERLGKDMSRWQYGQEKFHHTLIRHALSASVGEEIRSEIDAGPTPRGGNGYTVNMTGSGYNQSSGASFRIIADCGDWDNSLGTNCPGQSGNPESPHYKDLFAPWAKGRYFPVCFSRKKVEAAAESLLVLNPLK
jgi:penicillin amidase